MKLIREGNSHVWSAGALYHSLCPLSSPETSARLQAERHYPSFVAEESKAQK